MEELATIGYKFVCVAVFPLILYGILRAADRKKGIERRRGHLFGLLMLAVYLTGVFHVTGAGTVFSIRQYGLGPDVTQASLVPFANETVNIAAYLLNILLLVPLGFLLPFIWPEQDRFRSVLWFGISLSLFIEASQMLNFRNTDIDDLLLNTLGAIAGLLLFRLFARLTKRAIKPTGGRRYEAMLYLAAMCVGYFFLFDELGVVKILYGF